MCASLPTLALDTAAPSPNLAVLEGAEPTAELSLAPRPNAGRRVLEAAHALMQDEGVGSNEIERSLVGVGPGGFTGLRICSAPALCLPQTLGVPCLGASSLGALALSITDVAPSAATVVPVLDARRGEVFAAAYGVRPAGLLDEQVSPCALAPDALEGRVDRIGAESVVVGGVGVGALSGALSAHPRVLVSGPHAAPRAANLARLVDLGHELPVVPVYARLPDAEQKRKTGA